MRIAVLVKQVPRAETLELAPNGRLRRDGVELELNAYCRRAVSKGVELARRSGGTCTVFTLGPPQAEDALREAVAWGADDAVHVCDPAFAGSDTLATARALAAALDHEGSFDLVLAGRNSIDADTGQVPPQLAELLGMALVAGVKELAVDDGVLEARCELDDGWRSVRAALPAVVTTAERLCEPAKVDPEGRAAVDGSRIRHLGVADLGRGPWGAEGSPTSVGRVRVMEHARRRIRLEGPVRQQVGEAVGLLREWGALDDLHQDHHGRAGGDPVPAAAAGPGANGDRPTGPVVAVVVEPGRARVARELLGEAAVLARAVGGLVTAIGLGDEPAGRLGEWGADGVVVLDGDEAAPEEDVAAAVAEWCKEMEGAGAPPWALLTSGTLWGREVAGRLSARLGAGLTGDAVGLDVEDGRLVAWKPAFGGRLVAAITASTPTQMATVRPGVLALRPQRAAAPPVVEYWGMPRRGRVEITGAGRDDDVEALTAAHRVVAVGTGVAPDEYALLRPLLDALGAELGATRKVTDKGWLPRARQIGLTGHAVAPDLYVAVGILGKFNHVVGSRAAATIVAINIDPGAPIFEWADVGITADWHEAVPLLAEAWRAEVRARS